MSSHILIAGVAGGVQPRLEINNFVRNERHFSLYVQALQRMYDTPQDNFQSFFQVGGIHGLPYTAWDGSVGNPPVDPNAQWAGYCTHGSTLFPTWHRPYMMLIEQILNFHAQQIAETYTVDKAGWKQAAVNLRHPYWDWARNAVPPPEVISLPRLNIIAPNGSRTAVPNPLLRYRFHPIDGSFPPPYDRWPTTLRQPTSTGPTATDNVARLRNVLSNAQGSIRTATYNMLTRIRTWPAFSSHTVGDGGSVSNSIEAIHDNIHVLVGGNGQMSDPSVAAFDPIFFLHHANVDRMVSLWSAINPGVWITPGDSEGGTFTLLAETPVDGNTPLTPFWNQQTSFWISNNVRSTSSLGYTYPEFAGLNMNNPTSVRSSILRTVNNLYGSGSRSLTARAIEAANGTVTEDVKPREAEPAPVARGVQGSSTQFAGPYSHHAQRRSPHGRVARAPPRHLSYTGSYCDWTARVQFNRYELGGSFSVLLFLGEVPANPQDWLISPNLVGAHHAFVSSVAKQCPKCHHRKNMAEQGFVQLNEAIAKFSDLDSFDPPDVEPYLKRELRWRVQKTDGTPVELESLEISILDVPLTMAPGAETPVAGPPRRHKGITQGQPGGDRD